MFRALTLVGVLLLGASNSQADLIYDFRFDQSSYQAESGSTISVSVIFRETATFGEELRFASSALGLTSFGPVTLTYAPDAPEANVLNIASNSDIVINSDFTDTLPTEINNGDFSAVLGGSTISGIKIANNAISHEILVGTVTFQVVGNAGETAALSLSPTTELGTVFFDDEFFPAGPVSFESAQFTVTAIPEPSSLLGLSALGLFAASRRRRRKAS
ncbi:PEP-CTERM sorting domain-containing protein [Rhodopirellula sp. MGV]|uniref:PEP-CTERM sorting domain-containing protein n=1 Tax=Rhodopirellula sp. MGV TaxID=2023130 RepID=UPI000B970A69|nr:PEP-CTERM sorting domain-containing protein [Rhodopirellula sp. MGV]OYP38540.1 hypothetical protein CGZ80_02010 [Rhodopirellula sp. MGV]PNY34813.1 PEP-CTERM sorting domain-containing protein [Rhodopirellula baltica]